MKKLFTLLFILNCFFAPVSGTVHANTDAQKLKELHSLEDLMDYQSLKKPENLPGLRTDKDAMSYEAGQSFFYQAINIILFLAGLISVFFIILGGFRYVTNAGESDNQSAAKNTIIYAIVGLLIVLLSYAIVENTIRYIYDNHTFQENQGSYDRIDEVQQEDLVK